jgi:hypothetical protein
MADYMSQIPVASVGAIAAIFLGFLAVVVLSLGWVLPPFVHLGAGT